MHDFAHEPMSSTEPTHEQRRKRLNYANTLSLMAASAPDDETKRMVYSLVNTIRKRNGFTPLEKKAEVLRAIGLGASSVTDIVHETNFHKDEVAALIEQLVKDGLIVKRPMSLTGGAGRPTVCIFLK